MLSASPYSPSSKSSESNAGVSKINERVTKILERIDKAEAKAGRTKGSVTLIAVSKTKPADFVYAAAQCGVIHFGENYVQEASKKIDRLKLTPNIKWHLIGALQTNKSKSVVGKFETIQSVDRIELAKALNSRAIEAGVIQNILIQVKLGDEPAKGGIRSEKIKDLIREFSNFKNLRIEGLMSLPPIDSEAESSRKYFVQLRELQSQLAKSVSPEVGSFQHLSMGTTHDFEVAIEEGATMVRVGTALFGPREFFGT